MFGKNNPLMMYLLIIGVLMVVLAACNMPAPTVTSKGEPLIAATMTSQAVQEMIFTQFAPTATQPPTMAPQPTATMVLTPTAQATATSPTPTLNPEVEFCTDKASFVEDVTVSDGTIFSPGASFTKTWRLKNDGSCAWTPQYKLAFSDGDQMGGSAEVPFTGYVDPGQTIDLSVQLTAPAENGYYEGQWMIRSADGKLFGIGKDSEKPFWVRITVAQAVGELDLGAPTWIDTFDNATNWYLVSTDNTQFSVKNNRMVMEAFNPGEAEEWGLATAPAIKDFYLEATFKTGETCSGKDRYGVLFRAPDPNAGYVMGFSCEGRFRLYQWDGENYVALQEWKAAAEIVSGPDQTNRMGILAQSTTIKIYANGKLIGEYENNTYSKGRIGLFIASAVTEDFKVYVEDVAYWLVEE